MKPQDLRIGCFVKLRDTGEIVRVCGLLPKSVQYRKDLGDENDYRYCRYVDIEGVLIRDHWQKISSTYCNLQWLPDLGEDESLLYDYDGVTISYVHELQNLHYALTGEELKIEL